MTKDELLIIKGRVLQKMDDFENLLKAVSDRYTPNEEERERLFRSFDDLLRTIDEKISESERKTREKPESEPENEDQTADYDFVIVTDHEPGMGIIGYANSEEEAFYFKNLLAESYPDKLLKVFQRGRDDFGSWFYVEMREGGNKMRLIDADKLKSDCLTTDGHLAITQSQIAAAETVETSEGFKWIPIKTRPLTDKEREENPEALFYYDCPLPDDGEEVLVTTFLGDVRMDIFCRDPEDGSFFETYCDEDDVKAWARMPKPWEGKE